MVCIRIEKGRGQWLRNRSAFRQLQLASFFHFHYIFILTYISTCVESKMKNYQFCHLKSQKKAIGERASEVHVFVCKSDAGAWIEHRVVEHVDNADGCQLHECGESGLQRRR